jgi:hypothetical protein
VCISFSFQRKAEVKYTKKPPSLQGRSKSPYISKAKNNVFAGIISIFSSDEGNVQRTL